MTELHKPSKGKSKANTRTEVGKGRRYQPSSIDRFNDWVAMRSIPAWNFYVVFGIALIGVQLLTLGLTGGMQSGEIFPVVIFNGLFTPFLLALIYFLDNQAVAALKSMKSVLDTTEVEFNQYEYRLVNMPAPLPLAVGLIVLVLVILMEQLWIAPVRYAALEQLPVFAVVFHLVDKSSAFLFGVFIYHSIRQLRLVNAINTNLVRVNLYNLGPLQAFSRLTASTAVGLVLGVYGWMLINPELFADPLIIGFAGIITVLALAVFAWPLVGAHRLMKQEKARLLQEIDQHFEAVFAKFNQRLRDEDYSADRLDGTISSLEIQHKRISAIPTWPWRPETLRSVFTTIFLPLILTIIQYFTVQALGR